MKSKNPLITSILTLLIFSIGSILVIRNSDFYTFTGIMLLLWANNLQTRFCNEV
jgi:hypothetical protein